MRLILLFLGLFPFQLIAQSNSKYEFRAAWIATVSNIDWPSKRGLSTTEQQQEFINHLDHLKSLGCNTVIVQIRPACDAFYPSPIEPWSKYLTGVQGNPPNPYYDPLEFMIKETHARDMDFHAWFNPFRALVDKNKNPNPPNHVTYTHPEWLVNYGSKTYLNAGLPEVRKYVLDIICDVVKRYDIDAVHLDDYFYPYRIAGKEYRDFAAYNTYGNGLLIDDWRRKNITDFIGDLNISIKKIKPFMKLGISPFGVWRNSTKDPDGSNTHAGQTNYDDLYADIRLWLEKGIIDYALPQLYWEHGHRAAPFEILLQWWNNHQYHRHIYYGLGLYRMMNAHQFPWNTTQEITSQIEDIRALNKPTGYALYSASNFSNIHSNIDYEIKEKNKSLAFPPPMSWLPKQQIAPVKLKIVNRTISWSLNRNETAAHFAVYAFDNNENIDLSTPNKLLTITHNLLFELPIFNVPKTIVVTALDRLWNESLYSNKIKIGN